MLDLLRRKSSSIFVKVILGTIILVFVFFFGSSALQQGSGQNQVAARVNGEVIPQSLVNGMYEFQIENNPLYKQLPENLKGQLQQSILNALIEERVILSEAKKVGLRVSDAELEKEIKQGPQAQKDGKFDYAFYQEQFRPWFAAVYGIDFELWSRQNLLRSKFESVFNDAIFVSDTFIKKKAQFEKTEFSFSKIIIDPSQFINTITPDTKQLEAKKSELESLTPNIDPKELEAKALEAVKKDEATLKAENLAKELWPLFVANKLDKASLEKQGLTQIDVPEVPASQLLQITNGDESSIPQILALSPERPFIKEPLKLGSSYHFIKLTKKSSPTQEELSQMATDKIISMEESSQLMSQLSDALIKKASIKID